MPAQIKAAEAIAGSHYLTPRGLRVVCVEHIAGSDQVRIKSTVNGSITEEIGRAHV